MGVRAGIPGLGEAESEWCVGVCCLIVWHWVDGISASFLVNPSSSVITCPKLGLSVPPHQTGPGLSSMCIIVLADGLFSLPFLSS